MAWPADRRRNGAAGLDAVGEVGQDLVARRLRGVATDAGPRRAPLPTGRLGLAAVSVALFGVAALVALPVRGGAGPLRVDNLASRIVGTSRIGSLLGELHAGRSWSPALPQLIAGFGLPVVAAAVAAGFALVSWRRRDSHGVVLSLLGPSLAVFLTDAVVKPVVGRHRGGGLAYPSGHATGAAAVAVVALLLLYRWGGSRALVGFGPVALVLPAVMGLALVRFGWHYPTDVVGGTAMGAATALAVAASFGPHVRQPPSAPEEPRWPPDP